MYTPTSLTPLLFVMLGVQLKHHMTPSPIFGAWYSSHLVYNIICMYALSSTAKENINCRLPTYPSCPWRRFLLVHNFVVAQRWRTEGYRGRRKPVIEVSSERWLVRRMHVFVVIWSIGNPRPRYERWPFGGNEVAVKNKCGVALDVLSNAAVLNNEKLSYLSQLGITAYLSQ